MSNLFTPPPTQGHPYHHVPPPPPPPTSILTGVQFQALLDTLRGMDKGEDPMGLGRWSYITLRGKGTKRVVIVTAYNVCTTHNSNSGDTTAYKQQHRILHLSCFVPIIAKLPRIPTVNLFLIYNPGWRP
jgi:hypothetical protein